MALASQFQASVYDRYLNRSHLDFNEATKLGRFKDLFTVAELVEQGSPKMQQYLA